MTRTPVSSSRVARTPFRPTLLALAVGLAVSGMGGTGIAMAQERVFKLPRIDVVGQTDTDVARTPGSVTVVTEEEINEIQPRSTEDVLRRVPGIYIKGEEESAVVTNISVRGLTAGDYKTLVLEDGVPVQPGIFVGNARYYNPRVQRLEGVEVLKGAASLRYGPNTIGGVINYLTRTPEDGVSVIGRVGSWNTRETAVELGGSAPSGDSRFGIIATRAESDGFMGKGYDMTDVMVKAGTAIGDNQFIGAKFSYYESEANISYRGLFPDAYEAGAKFNPAPDDWFLSGRTAFDINHEWEINPSMHLKTLVYWSETYRDYWRYRLASDTGTGPATTTNADGYTVWNYGDEVQGNNRSFERIGVDSRLTMNHSAFGIGNEAEFGMRLMQEEMTDTRPRADRATPRNPNGALHRNRLDSADSLAVFAQNRFDINERLSVTAGLRMETYEQKRDNLQNTNPADTFSNTEYMPGIGATYWLNPSAQLYGSVYRAFAPPLVGSVIGSGDTPTESEKSVNIELGVRGSTGPLRYEVTAFQMDFSNQVDPGVSGIRDPNEGKALHQGLEAALGYDFGNGFRVDGNVTWIPTAEYREDRPGEAVKGNRLAYSPEWMANLSLGYQSGPLQTALLLNYVGERYGDGMNTKELTTESTGVWGGLMPSHATVDLTGRYAVSPQLNVFGAVKNLTDERYIAGLRQGIYVGPERSFELGVKYTF
ncbi:TonB-dependent receptor family protein [Thioalkalivibrio thiocyanodenitrificans]|uniref:TonB-dependent receptor family protein n=1 Tax=Thioalkalivibrio thiocyanodenitrificans TaxID=243063 RepID=UPI00037B0760|nr:TonB-dependent receptor [Thioalkalivibrio thiocyanodenitrificans]